MCASVKLESTERIMTIFILGVKRGGEGGRECWGGAALQGQSGHGGKNFILQPNPCKVGLLFLMSLFLFALLSFFLSFVLSLSKKEFSLKIINLDLHFFPWAQIELWGKRKRSEWERGGAGYETRCYQRERELPITNWIKWKAFMVHRLPPFFPRFHFDLRFKMLEEREKRPAWKKSNLKGDSVSQRSERVTPPLGLNPHVIPTPKSGDERSIDSILIQYWIRFEKER